MTRREPSSASPTTIGAVEVPEGWSVLRTEGPRPFITRAVLRRPDGTAVVWSSRAHRKRLALRPAADGPAVAASAPSAAGARPSTRSWTIGGLFMIGAFCFALGSVPLYFDNASAVAVATTFFVGSIFFTSAAYLQYQEALDAPTGPSPTDPSPAGLPRFVALSPHRIDWWATAVQFVGTIMFNISTFAAIDANADVMSEERWVWAPDVLGSACFLIASWLAFAEVGPRLWHRGERTLGWWISALNMLGSITFGIAAIAGRYTSSGELVDVTLVNLGTFVGAACFFIGAALLPVESAREG